MGPLQIVLIVLVIVVGVVLIGVFMRMNTQAEERRRRLEVIAGKSVSSGDGTAKKNVQDERRAEIAKKLKEQGDGDDDKKRANSLVYKIGQAGLKVSVQKFLVVSFAFAAVLTLFCLLLKVNVLALPAIFITAALGIPRMVLGFLSRRRQKKFLEEFADALEAMVRLLKAGMPVSEAISMVAREYTGPVGEEMARIYDEQKIGVPLPEAAQNATKRMPLTEMQMFATGLSIQAQTGASLSEVLTNLANVIRARFKLKRKVKALSSEAKASAMIIGSLPVFVSGGIYAINPEYLMPLFTEPMGKAMLGGALFWMGLGIVVMKIMINFKV